MVCRKNRETGTEMVNKLAIGDLMIWLPETKRERIPFAPTFKDLVRLTILLKFTTFWRM